MQSNCQWMQFRRGNSKPNVKMREVKSTDLRQNLADHAPAHVGKPEVPATVSIHQPRVVDAQLMQHRRLQIMRVNTFFHSPQTEVIGRPVRDAAAETAAGDHGGKTQHVMIAPLVHRHNPGIAKAIMSRAPSLEMF